MLCLVVLRFVVKHLKRTEWASWRQCFVWLFAICGWQLKQSKWASWRITKRHNHNQCHVALLAFFKPSASQPEEETSMNRPLTKQTCTAWDPLYRSSLQAAFVGIELWLRACLRSLAPLGLPLTRVCRLESPTVAYRRLVVFSPHFSLLLFAEWRM